MHPPNNQYKFSIASIDLDKELGRGKFETIQPEQSIQPKPASRLFIKGPIPFDWLQKANSLGGSTGTIAIGLWFYVGINSSKYFKVDSKLDRFTGVSRQTRQSALQKLQSAGLIKLWCRHGGYPFVEVLASP
jgi:hypothetical protein